MKNMKRLPGRSLVIMRDTFTSCSRDILSKWTVAKVRHMCYHCTRGEHFIICSQWAEVSQSVLQQEHMGNKTINESNAIQGKTLLFAEYFESVCNFYLKIHALKTRRYLALKWFWWFPNIKMGEIFPLSYTEDTLLCWENICVRCECHMYTVPCEFCRQSFNPVILGLKQRL